MNKLFILITIWNCFLLFSCHFGYADTDYLQSGKDSNEEKSETASQNVENLSNPELEARNLYQKASDLIDKYGGNTLLLNEALSYLKKAIELKKDFVEAYIKIGSIMVDFSFLSGDNYNQDYAKEAFFWIEKAREINPDFPDLHRVTAKTYFALKKYDSAEQEIQRAIELDGKSSLFYFWLGRISKAKKEYDKAIEALNKAIVLDPNSPRNYDELGLVYLALKDYANSLQMFKKELELQPDSAWGWNNYSLPLIKLGRYDEAIEACQNALKIMNFGVAHQNLGVAYMGKKMYKEAEKEFILINATKMLSELYRQMGEPKKEMKMLDETLREDSQNSWAYVEKARILKNQNSLDKALLYYGKALEINPQYALAYYDLGQIYEIKGNIDKAIELYNKAIELDGKMSMAYYELGRVYEDKKNDSHRAITYLAKSIELNPNYANAYYSLAKAYENIDDRKNSIPNFEKYLELAPNGSFANFVRGYLKRIKNE